MPRATRNLDLEWDARVTIDRTTGKIYVYELVPVGEPDEETGEYAEFEERDVTPEGVSRIAAQNAKGVIAAMVREAGRQSIYEEFSDRVGDIVTATVLQATPDFTIVKIRDGVEAELPHYDQKRNPNERNERPMGEHYRHNQRIKVLIIDVRDPNSLEPHSWRSTAVPLSSFLVLTPSSCVVFSSTRCPKSMTVPSRSSRSPASPATAPRSPSTRATTAWIPWAPASAPRAVVSRIVVGELRGERVDVILWDADPAVYVANALSPAKVTRVLIDEDKDYAGVIVPDDQLSLAIGKEGQNARLAARLTGWHIDIKSETLAADILKNVPVHEEPAADLIGDEEDDDVRRCEYVSEDGVQCRNQARPGSRFCGVHDTDAFDDAEDLI